MSNPFSWNNVANMIYIDQVRAWPPWRAVRLSVSNRVAHGLQPAGTGFSTGNQAGYAHNETTVGDDMYVFLQAFFQTFPQYQSNDFYITGESCTCAGCRQAATSLVCPFWVRRGVTLLLPQTAATTCLPPATVCTRATRTTRACTST